MAPATALKDAIKKFEAKKGVKAAETEKVQDFDRCVLCVSHFKLTRLCVYGFGFGLNGSLSNEVLQ